ncbi:histidine phosphatase family protein [Leucothrix arctica]|uniref:Histidine phosphatase family protein n=1 Tax=Leucothrix arctica TaxID=1481894 RepID=A0A317CJ03_9GAMM|nr:histidine phosphatase family protein [Leucothrix arctica]PWQ98309.1 histidine phosphatase family protein [Leucothrix arctica]
MPQTTHSTSALSRLKQQLSTVTKQFWQLPLLVFSCLIFTTGSLQADETAALKSLKSGNHFAIMRHALAPGMGDPSNFDLQDCSTQRNLSQRGIDQAVNIGKRFRDSGITEAQVFTSEWCRCIDTAKYLDLNTPIELPLISSFFETREQASPQTLSLNAWLLKQDLSKPIVLVTHQVNITALTGVFPASGEIIIVKREEDGTLTVANRVQTD